MSETLNSNFVCNICKKAFSTKGHLTRHINAVHNKIKDYVCGRDGCKSAFSDKSKLDRHIKAVHNKIKDNVCDIDGCTKAFSEKSDLDQHLSNIHNIDVKWFYCPQDGCKYKCKKNAKIKEHLANIHDIDVKWFYCPKDGCKYKSKCSGTLKQHLSNIHNIGVKWFYCPEDGCDYKSKNNGKLKRHQRTCMGIKGIGSNGEKYVKQCLSDLGFVLDEDYVFNNSFYPLSQYANKNLRPDFRFLNHNIIIEYDGEQHFRPKAFGKISQEQAEENFKETQENDKLKDDFCKENGFKMIRIPYTKFANTLSILSVELHDIVDWVG